jgi:hypothetical protein
VTEAEWDACADPKPMLWHLDAKGSGRKLRLYAVACCRKIMHLFHDERSRRVIEVMEDFVDGKGDRKYIRSVANAAAAAFAELDRDGRATAAEREAVRVICKLAETTHPLFMKGYDLSSDEERRLAHYAARGAGFFLDRKVQCHLLRCIFGNSFRPAPAVDLSWLAWNGGTVGKLAAAIYDERRIADLPILADALEDAGCTDAVILAHCRGPGEHVRGCWVVDLLTGRQ